MEITPGHTSIELEKKVKGFHHGQNGPTGEGNRYRRLSFSYRQKIKDKVLDGIELREKSYMMKFEKRHKLVKIKNLIRYEKSNTRRFK